MYSSQPQEITFSDILGTLWRHRTRCIITMAAVLIAAILYAVFMPPVWEASQAIVVRDNAAMHFGPTARGRNEVDAKNTQQTLQEMTSSWSLLKNALEKVGPSHNDDAADSWPSDKAVDSLRTAVNLTPPNGSEFGKTDVFYLKVKNRDRDRALTLTDAIYAELEKRFGELQASIARSEIIELKESVTLAQENLTEATKRLSSIEKEAGVDLVALRMLHQSPTGDTYVFRTLTAALDELRLAKASQSQHQAMLEVLKKAEENPQIMTAAPRELLDYHPGLARMIQGLAESRLRGFAEASRLTEEHCDMQALRREEAGVREGIQQELAAAIQGVAAAQELAAARRAMLETQVNDLNQRLTRLTEMRAEYSNLAGQVEHDRNLVDEAQRNLSQAQAAFTAATASSVLSRMDLADGGVRPVSASRTMVGLGGLLASVLGGTGMVFLTAPIQRRRRHPSHELLLAQTPRRLRRSVRRAVEPPYAETTVVAEGGNT